MAVVGLVAVGAAWAENDKNVDNKSLGKLEGRWRLVKGEENGKPVAAERIKDDYLVVKGNHMTMVATDQRRSWEIAFRADPSQMPARLTMKVVKGEGKGKTAHGIYTVAGDTLKIAYAVGAKDYPKDFDTKEPGEGFHMMFVLQRERPEINK